jgi:phage regulator Rha-like protein
MPKTLAIVPVERIESRILLIRGHKVMLDSDLAEVYHVSTKRLNEQVKRNRERFPEDFMFQLTHKETANLWSQSATSNSGRGGRRYRPYAFTEHGAVMLASVLNSPVAVQASIQVVRAFIRLREILATHRQLARQLADLEQKYDKQFKVVFDAIRELMAPPKKERKQIGFQG